MQPLPLSALLALAMLLGPGSSSAEVKLEDYYQRSIQRAVALTEKSLVGRVDFFEPKDTWEQAFVVTSEHYRVSAVGSRSAANKLVHGLEYMLGQFQSLLDSDYVPAQRFQVDVLPLAEYNARGDNAAEHSSFYGSFLESDGRVAISYNPNSEYLGILATHSACHQFIEAAFGKSLPYWISEGLAAYFASFWNPEWSKSELQRVSGGPAWIGMRALLSGAAPDYLKDGNTRLIELGMLFKYLLHFNPESSAEAEHPFVDFLRVNVRGQRGNSQLYGPSALQKYEQDFRKADY